MEWLAHNYFTVELRGKWLLIATAFRMQADTAEVHWSKLVMMKLLYERLVCKILSCSINHPSAD